jgi:uncharacterized protein
MRTLNIKNREEIDDIIRSCKTCYLAMSNHDQPYVLPMNFALDGDNIILHSAQNGRKWDIMKINPKVCIIWTMGEELAWQDPGIGCSYRVKSKSVIVEGLVEFVEDHDEKIKCMEKLMSQYRQRMFKFSRPAITNVGVMKVHIQKIDAKKFGEKAKTAWNKSED